MVVLNPYGASLDSGAGPNAAGQLFSTQNMIGAMLNSNTSVARYQIEWAGIERAVQTTSSTPVSSTGTATITVASLLANFTVGTQVLVDAAGSHQETVTISAVGSTTITATFAKTHTSNQTTSSTPVSSTGSHTITLAAVPSNFAVGVPVSVDTGGQQETVTITALNTTNLTLTATFAKTHTSTPYTVTGPYPVAAIPQPGDTPSSSGSPARVAAYDWSVFDDYITTAQSNGFFIDFVLQNAPLWHQTALAIDSTKSVPAVTDAGVFVTALFAHLQSAFGSTTQLYTFEVANEGFNTTNLTSSNASQMFSQMYSLLSTVQPIVKANSANTLVGAPAELNKATTNIAAWITGFYAANCHTLVDYLNFHYYNGNSAPDNPNPGDDSFAQWWSDLHTASVANNDATRPIWVTETGWTLLRGSNGGVADATLAGYLTTLLQSAIFSTCVQRVMYYNLGQIAPGSGQNQNFTNQSYLAWKNTIAQYPQWGSAHVLLSSNPRRDGIVPATARRA